MKFSITVLFIFLTSYAKSQNIMGNWYSQDSTRIYTIYKTGDFYEGVLKSSTRPKDKVGAIVLTNVFYSNRKKKLTGIIHSVSDSNSTMTKIKFEDEGGKILKFRLRRMFFMNVTIRWYRIEASKMTKL